MQYGILLFDLVKAFERIEHELLVEEAVALEGVGGPVGAGGPVLDDAGLGRSSPSWPTGWGASIASLAALARDLSGRVPLQVEVMRNLAPLSDDAAILQCVHWRRVPMRMTVPPWEARL